MLFESVQISWVDYEKIYNVDPLLCPKCLRPLKIIAFIWDLRHKPPEHAHGPPTEAFIIYVEFSAPSADEYLIDADYPIETISKNPAIGTPVSIFKLA